MPPVAWCAVDIAFVICSSRFRLKPFKQDNVRDHRAGTSDLIIEKHTQVRLRVHHIVIRDCELWNTLLF